MSNERMDVLQLLADGKIDAGQAAAMLNGKASESDPVAAASIDEVEVEVEFAIDEEIVIEKSAETDPPIVEKSVESIEIIESRADHSKDGNPQKLRVTVTGKPVTANLNITVPISLLKFGTHIGSYFEPEIDGADWESLDVEFAAGEQTIRLVVE